MHALGVVEGIRNSGTARDGLAGARILLVEDPCPMRNALADAIGAEGFHVNAAAEESDVLATLSSWSPNLVLLDLSVDEARGLSICRRVREESSAPIVVMASPGEEARVVLALELGATDYLTRPLDFDSLLARMRTALTRATGFGDIRDGILEVGPIVLHLARREVSVRGQMTPFRKLEYDLLLALVLQPGHIRTRAELLDRVWGRRLADTKTLDAHMRRLRIKIEPDHSHPRHIITVRGVGYYFDPQEHSGTEGLPAPIGS
jgi:two-component system response regulator RegX3